MKVGRIMESERERAQEGSVRRVEVKRGEVGKLEVVEDQKQ